MDQSSITDVERPAFFEGQRLTADDLSAGQSYSQEMRWLHNRALHGFGVSLGLTASGAAGDREVTVSPGYALDRLGRELLLEDACTLQVPADAGPSAYLLTIAYADDAGLVTEERAGVCGSYGAVRLRDQPVIGWRDPLATDPEALYRPGIDIVLAAAQVKGCKLRDDLALGARDELVRPRPQVFAGTTQPGATFWRLWPDEAAPLGVTTTVATSAAGFARTPLYQARLGGARTTTAGPRAVYDGHVHLDAATASSFEFRVLLPSGRALVTADEKGQVALNPRGTLTPNLAARLGGEMSWHVVWLGIES